MKHHNMLPFRRAALAAAALFIATTSAQEWGGQSQEYCSNQNTGSDYNAVTNIYNTYLTCSEQCKADYAFAVVQYQSCWCSDYIPADQSSTDDCNQSCPGYPDNKCGNSDAGVYGYIALDKSPSGTAGGGSSSQASSTAASTSSSERVSTSTTSSSFSQRETTSSSSSVFFSSSTTPVVSSSESSSDSSSTPPTSSTAPVLTSSSQTSSSQATSTSYSSSPEPSTSSSTPPTTSSSSSPMITSSSSSPPPTTSSSSYSAAPETTTSSSSYTGSMVESTPAPVISTRIVTISGEAVTETVTSTPTPIKVPAGAENELAHSSDSLSGGAIAGIVIAVLAFLGLLALVIFLLWRRRQAKDPNNPHGFPEMATASNPRPTRNVSVLSKVGLLARSTHDPHPDDDADPSSAGASHSARHSAFFAAGAAGASDGVSPSSPLGPGSNASTSLYQMDSRRHSKPLVYDQRLNPSALFANADANGSRISMADNTDYSRPLDFGAGKLAVRNPDPRSSFESRN